MHVKPAGLLLIGIEIPPLRYAAVGMTRNNNSPKNKLHEKQIPKRSV